MINYVRFTVFAVLVHRFDSRFFNLSTAVYFDFLNGTLLFRSVYSIAPKENLIEHGRRFDGKHVPSSGRDEKKFGLQNQVYRYGELFLYRWLHKQWALK